MFGFVAAGGVIGATAGALLADRLSVFLAPNQLLFAASAVLALTALGPFAWPRQRVGAPSPARSRPRTSPNGLRVVCTEPYLRRLLMLVVTSTVALTAVDYLFKHTVAHEVAQAALGPFFARVYLVVNVLALVVQLAFSSWLLGSVGVGRAMRVLPLLLTAGILGFAALLRRTLSFAHRQLEALADLVRDSAEMRLEAGESLWVQGDTADHVVIPVWGSVECKAPEVSWRFRLHAGDVVGGLDALAEEPRWCTVTALEPVVALRIDMETLHDLLEDNFEMALEFLQLVASRLLSLYEIEAGRERLAAQ